MMRAILRLAFLLVLAALFHAPSATPAVSPAAPVSAPGLFPDPSTDGSFIVEC